MRASVQRVQTRLVYTNSNRSFNHRMMLTRSSGMQKNGWAYSFRFLSVGHNQGIYLALISTRMVITSLSTEKINEKHSLSLMGIGAPVKKR